MRSEQDDFLLEQHIRFGGLFDLYAPILTEKQRASCELLLRADLSIAELAEELGMTRQGAHDLIRRSREQLENIESSLHLQELKERMDGLLRLVDAYRGELPQRFIDEMRALSLPKEESADV